MAIPLTKEQQQAIDSKEPTPPEIVDPRTGAAYVLIRAEEYESVREVLIEERQQKAIRAVALRNARAGFNRRRDRARRDLRSALLRLAVS